MEHSFTLLGSGTSTGVPLPGCSCAVCSSNNPKNFRDRTSGYIELASGEGILIDAGPDLRYQAIKNSIKRVDAVLYTHAHADHIYGTDDLRCFNFLSNRRITCYGSEETLKGLRYTFPYILQPDPSYRGAQVAKLDLLEISNLSGFTVFNTEVTAFPLPHGNTTVTGFRIGSLGYATDCKGLTERAAEVLRGVEYLFIDGLRWEPHNTHNSIDEAIAIARALGVKQCYLVHTTHTIDYDEVSAALPAGIELGYDGLSVVFEG